MLCYQFNLSLWPPSCCKALFCFSIFLITSQAVFAVLLVYSTLPRLPIIDSISTSLPMACPASSSGVRISAEAIFAQASRQRLYLSSIKSFISDTIIPVPSICFSEAADPKCFVCFGMKENKRTTLS